MLKFKSLPLVGALATVALTRWRRLGNGCANHFGQLTPQAPDVRCRLQRQHEGAICGQFADLHVQWRNLYGNGFYGDTFGTPSALTLKDHSGNGVDESGLGENADGAQRVLDGQAVDS